MQEINISADKLVQNLLALSETETVCFLDSCGVSHLGSHFLIAGIKPVETLEIRNKSVEKTLSIFDEKLSEPNTASIFTISYDFGLRLEHIEKRTKNDGLNCPEPDVFLATFDCLIIHNYNTKETFLAGNKNKFAQVKNAISNSPNWANSANSPNSINSNLTKTEYISKIQKIQEFIRCGDTYQTNLTQQIRADLPKGLTPQQIFWNLRKQHPAPFASFIKRKNDYVVSISPERFAKVENGIISTSPIKGTRPRGKDKTEDLRLKNELLTSEKDRAENVMIVDLLRNDIGRICEFGSVKVEKLCDLEEHPTLFHLVSTISGKLRKETSYADIIKAIFPCGSITGCPKIRTMEIIDELETTNRGLSMGAIGYSIPDSKFQISDSATQHSKLLDLSVAIRTMVIRDDTAIFNVGGGIVIDSIPEDEYKESLVKAKALFKALGVNTN